MTELDGRFAPFVVSEGFGKAQADPLVEWDLTTEQIEPAFATARTYTKTGQQQVSLAGCLYNASGCKVAASERVTANPDDWIRAVNQPTERWPKDAPRLAGSTLFFPHASNHYGHCLLESMSAAWVDAGEYDRVILYSQSETPALPRYWRDLLAPFRLPDPVLIGHTALSFDRVVVPARALILSGAVHPEMRRIYDTIVTYYAPAAPEPTDVVWLSRSRAPRKHGAIRNEEELEEAACEFGLRIVRPEELSVPEQVALMQSSRFVAGLSGSALHNAVFMQDRATLLELGDVRTPSRPIPPQGQVAAISRSRSLFAPLVVSKDHAERWDVDAARRAIEFALRTI